MRDGVDLLQRRCVVRMAVLSIGAFGAAALLSGCAPGRSLPLLPNPPATAYRLGAGDQIRVITFGAEQLSGTFRIDDAGQFAMPLLGTVTATGNTATGLAGKLEAELKRKKLIDSPSVAVQIESFRPFYILGEVARPGPYPFQPGMTVLTAVSVAGGFTYRAFDDYAAVVRTEGDHAVEGRVSRQSLIQPGDVITVYERHF